MVAQHMRLMTSIGIPKPDRLVEAASGDSAPVGAVGSVSHVSRVTAEGEPRSGIVGHVPDLCGQILDEKESRSIGRETGHLTSSLDCTHTLGVVQAPELDLLVGIEQGK